MKKTFFCLIAALSLFLFITTEAADDTESWDCLYEYERGQYINIHAEETRRENGFTYYILDEEMKTACLVQVDEATVTEEGTLVIPGEIAGYTVVGLCDIFDGKVKTVDFSGTSITRLGYQCLDDDVLEQCILPPTIKELGVGCFGPNLKEIILPEGLEIIDDYAFAATKLKEITFPSTVHTIGYMAFDNCEMLEKIVFLPGALQKIEPHNQHVFDTPRLKELTIPPNITHIGINEFQDLLSGRGMDQSLGFNEGLVVYGENGSYAESWANEKGLLFSTKTKVMLEGQEIVFADQQPIIKAGRTLVPARSVFEELGAVVSWDGETQTVTVEKDEISVQIPIGSNVLLKNGEEKKLDVPAEIINERTMIPLRAVSEVLDCYVAWAQAQNAVHIYGKSASEKRNKILADRFRENMYWVYDIYETEYGTVIQCTLVGVPHRTGYEIFLLDAEGNYTRLDSAVLKDGMNIHPRAEYIAIWEDGKTMTYSVTCKDRAVKRAIDPETGKETIEIVYYEPGVYYYSVNLETGENILTDFMPKAE